MPDYTETIVILQYMAFTCTRVVINHYKMENLGKYLMKHFTELLLKYCVPSLNFFPMFIPFFSPSILLQIFTFIHLLI